VSLGVWTAVVDGTGTMVVGAVAAEAVAVARRRRGLTVEMRRTVDMIRDALVDEPDGDYGPGRPGLINRVAMLEQHVAAVDRKLTPNGMNTMTPGDMLARTEQKVDELLRRLDERGDDTP
jgi:hypothetical protein